MSLALTVAGYKQPGTPLGTARALYEADVEICEKNAEDLQKSGAISLEATTKHDFKLSTKSMADRDTSRIDGAKERTLAVRTTLRAAIKGNNEAQGIFERHAGAEILKDAIAAQ